ncbi:hypothetical protein E4T44_14130 [Aureobasidium sp. EXF-8845]|nr:hypothetical protein E4T44_14130 [Aureobasidium sp. EXF-8845]KAI4791589.1 hypothetical protein E4T45_12925 [Aureobasidium sp. EXF-8846]
MENNIPRNTPALLGTLLLSSNKYHNRKTHTSTARIDQLRNSLFNRFEKLLEQAQPLLRQGVAGVEIEG